MWVVVQRFQHDQEAENKKVYYSQTNYIVLRFTYRLSVP